MTPPRLSSGEASRPITPEDLLAASEIISQRGIFGVAWLDEDLVVRARYGALADFVAIGVPVGLAILPLFGLEENIKALRRRPEGSVDYPNVSVITEKGVTPKLNLSVYWINRQSQFVVLLALVRSQSDIELELNNQARARIIAEARIVEQAKEIARANRDLAEFAYIISHDLQAPMRALRYAIDDLEASLDAPVHPHGGATPTALMAEIRQHARRMSTMMTGLLGYSRIGRKEAATERVRLDTLIASIVASMPRRDGTAIEIAGDWPDVVTLVAPLDLVLRNLIDNAIKHHDQRAGRITVTCRRPQPARLEFIVEDDGPGIRREHHDTVFKPFVRLNPEVGEPGSGIGLSMVRKMIESVGGTLRLESDPDQRRGTRFVIGWPLPE